MIEAMGQLLLRIVSLILVMGLVVTIHELGHYLAGRMFGTAADSFAFGFGPSLFETKDKRGTRWRVNALPFGGFVSFTQKDENGEFYDPRHKELVGLPLKEIPLHGRALVYAAGPIANFILAILLFAGIVLANGQAVHAVSIGQVYEGPAQQAGFQTGDIIKTVNGVSVQSEAMLIEKISLSTGDNLSVAIDRGGEALTLTVTPERRDIERLGQVMSVGAIGVGLTRATVETVRHNPVSALLYGVNETGAKVNQTINVLGRIITGKESINLLSGPVAIADASGRVVDATMAIETIPLMERVLAVFWFYISFCAIVSIGVGFINLLPLPVLDGGHLAMCAYEAITGSEVPAQVQGAVIMGGFALIIGLFVVITGGDIVETGILSSQGG